MSVAAVEPEPGTEDGAAPVEGEPTTDDAAEAPDTGTEETTEETPAEGEPEAAAEGEEGAEPAEAKAPVDLDEETLRSAAFKFANKTMAAVRRAEKRVEAVKNENATYKQHLQVYAGFVERLQKGDVTALREIGIGSVREFLDRAASFGDPEKPEPIESRFEKLERQLREKEENGARAAQEAAVADSQAKVFAHIDGDKKRWRFTATKIGHAELWDACGEYFRLHGDVPDAVVPMLADAVEKGLRAEFGEPDSGLRQPAKNGASPSPAAASGGRNSGKTLTNRGSAGAPAPKRYSDDPDERRKQVAEDLRREGLLSGGHTA